MALKEVYHFTRRQNSCAVTGEPFQDGQIVYTAIFVGLSEEGYLRKDYSEHGWLSHQDGKPFSYWKSKWKIHQKPEEDKPLEKESAESLLRKLSEEGQSEEDLKASERTRYVLALMLERSKVLREIESQSLPDGTLRVYQHKKSEEVFLVKDPNLSLDQILDLQVEVVQLLDSLET